MSRWSLREITVTQNASRLSSVASLEQSAGDSEFVVQFHCSFSASSLRCVLDEPPQAHCHARWSNANGTNCLSSACRATNDPSPRWPIHTACSCTAYANHASVDATACSTCSEPLGQRSAASMRLRRSLLGQSRVRRTQAESRQSCSILGKDRHRCTRDLSILLLHMWSLNR